MDSQIGHKGPPFPFARPPMIPVSQTATTSPSYPPIPPPPYSSQSSTYRPDIPPRHDPFLPNYPRYNSHISSPALARHASPFTAHPDTPYASRFGPSPPSPHYNLGGSRPFGNTASITESKVEEHHANGQQGMWRTFDSSPFALEGFVGRFGLDGVPGLPGSHFAGERHAHDD